MDELMTVGTGEKIASGGEEKGAWYLYRHRDSKLWTVIQLAQPFRPREGQLCGPFHDYDMALSFCGARPA